MYDPLFVHANQAEAVFWIAIGMGFAVRGETLARQPERRGNRRLCWLAAAVLMAFGASDLVETQTGAWWRPWWLLLWKAACVIALACC